MELARQLDRALELRPGIVALEPRMLAVEQRGGQHVIAVGGIVVRQLADMVGDPEDFLDQDEPAAAFAFRLRVINGNVGAVVHRHADHLAHRHYPSPVRIELVAVPFFLPPFGERTVLRQATSMPPRWRGPNGRGIVSDKSPPSHCIPAKTWLRAPRLCSVGIVGSPETGAAIPPGNGNTGL